VIEVIAGEVDVGVIDLSVGPGIEVCFVVNEFDAIEGIGIRGLCGGHWRAGAS